MVVDNRENPPGLQGFRKAFPGIAVEVGEFSTATLRAARELVMSPGVSLAEPAVAEAVASGVPVTGDIDRFSRHAPAPIVAVTGSNGKSTGVSLVAEILRYAGVDFGLGGNLDSAESRPALDLLQDPPRDLYLLELSSFQLETTANLGAEVAAILNFSEDHMDRYASLEAYLAAKQRIFRGANSVVVNRDSAYSAPPDPGNCRIVDYGLDEPVAGSVGLRRLGDDEFLAYGNQNLLATRELKMMGRHNIANALAALSIAIALKVDLAPACNALRNFRGLPHRCEWVDELRQVTYINDSKGTNVGATMAAIEGLADGPGRVILIAGGVGKGADFSPLKPVIGERIAEVILIGAAAAELAALLEGPVPVNFATDMHDAVARAEKLASPGDRVLLSPACASFDMFRDFTHRGQVFRDAVRSLK